MTSTTIAGLGRLGLYALLALQFWFAWHYWGSFGATGEWRILPGMTGWQIAGVALTTIEAGLLIWHDIQKARGQTGKANFLFALFVVVFLVNGLSDMGAVSTMFADSLQSRQELQATFDASKMEQESARDTAERSKDNLNRALDAVSLNLPASTLHRRLDGQTELDSRWRQQYGDAPLPRSYVTDRQDLTEAIENVAARDGAAENHNVAIRNLGALGARPENEHPAIANLAQLTGRTGAELMAWLALVLAIIIKVCIGFGFWTTDGGPGVPGRADSPSLKELLQSDRWKFWRGEQSDPPQLPSPQGVAPPSNVTPLRPDADTAAPGARARRARARRQQYGSDSGIDPMSLLE